MLDGTHVNGVDHKGAAERASAAKREENLNRFKAMREEALGSTPRRVPLTEIVVKDEIQPRTQVDSRSVQKYEQMMLAAAQDQSEPAKKKTAVLKALDPLIAFEVVSEDGAKVETVLSSGHQRLKALKAAQKRLDPEGKIFHHPEALVRVVKGKSLADCAFFAGMDNAEFRGAQMHLEDWQKFAKNLIRQYPSHSSRAIQAMMPAEGLISHVTVNNLIKEMAKAGEVDMEARRKVVTATGKQVRGNVKSKPASKGFKQANGKDFPVNLDGILSDTAIERFIAAVKAFREQMPQNRACRHVPPKVDAMLENVATVLEDSLPGNACPLCQGEGYEKGCAECSGTGYLPRRESYGPAERVEQHQAAGAK